MNDSLWEILVPMCDNKGKKFDISYHRKWDDMVRNIANGLTIFKSAKGIWVSPNGMLFKERMIPVRIKTNIDNINMIVDFTLKHYGQEFVMAYQISEKVILKRRDQ